VGIDEALELLGVTREDDDDRVRRAYLKAVRRHPPERDPEGFQRVREAYELAKSRRFAFIFVPGDDLERAEAAPDDESLEAATTEEAPGSPADVAPPSDDSDDGVADVMADAEPGPEVDEALDARDWGELDDEDSDGSLEMYVYDALMMAAHEPTAEAGERAVEWATRWVDEERGPLPLERLGLATLELLAAGHFGPARALVVAGRRWVEAAGSELDAAGDAPLHWLQARDLVAMAPSMGDGAVEAIARALLDDDYALAGRRCNQELSTPAARNVAAKSAPLLWSLALKARRRVDPEVRSSKVDHSWTMWPLALLLFFGIKALVVNLGRPDHHVMSPTELRERMDRVVEDRARPGEVGGGEIYASRRERARAELSASLAAAVRTCAPGDCERCRALADALYQFEQRICWRAITLLEEVEAGPGRPAPPSTAGVEEALRSLRSYCRTGRLPPPAAPNGHDP